MTGRRHRSSGVSSDTSQIRTPVKHNANGRNDGTRIFRLKSFSSKIIGESNTGADAGFTACIFPDDFYKNNFTIREELIISLIDSDMPAQNNYLSSVQIALVKPLQSAALKQGQIAVSNQFLSMVGWNENWRVSLHRFSECKDVIVTPATLVALSLTKVPIERSICDTNKYLKRYLSETRRFLLEKAAFFSAQGHCLRMNDSLNVWFEGVLHVFSIERLEPLSRLTDKKCSKMDIDVLSESLENLNLASESCNVTTRERLETFYKLHNPTKMNEIDDILNRYAGREEAMFTKLERKYGVNSVTNGSLNRPEAEITEKKMKFLWRIHSETKCIIKVAVANVITGNQAGSMSSLVEPSWSDNIGGLSTQIQQLRETIEMPLKRPELFQHYGVRPPRGVLLHGPPGTGKTKLARAAGAACGVEVIAVNGPELLSSFIGGSEDALRKVFHRAASLAPCLLVLDEIDVLCPKRDASGGGGDAERRMATTLLTLLDGTDSFSGVAIIGCTNRSHVLDPALRRPGRLDREIEIGVPDEAGRIEILEVLLKCVPHNLTMNQISRIGASTHGFVGADLHLLIKESVLSAVRRWRSNKRNSNGSECALGTSEITVEWLDFEAGRVHVAPSGLREVAIEVPKVHWDDIGGQEEVKRTLQEVVEWPLKHPEAFIRMGVAPPRGVLLYGPPGCSKTLMARALATESSMNFIAVKGPELLSKWLGESERALQAVFKRARSAAPTIIFFDEIDAIANTRQGNSGGGGTDRVLSQLLVELDGIQPLKRVVVVAATNRPDTIDAALLRPGRLDRLVYVQPPSVASRLAILKLGLKNIPNDIDEDAFRSIAEKTEGFSGAEIIALCREASMSAVSDVIEGRETITEARVKELHLISALSYVTPQITSEILSFYEKFGRRKK